MSASAIEQPLPTAARNWTIVGTVLAGALVFSLNSRGSVLETPVIVQSNGSSPDLVITAIRLGARDFFIKPVSAEHQETAESESGAKARRPAVA